MKSFIVIPALLALVAIASATDTEFKDNEVEMWINKLVPRIVNGEKAFEEQFPHQASLAQSHPFFGEYITSPFCGASVIADRWLLTAAHCLVGKRVSQLRGIVGTLNVRSRIKTVNVERVFVHESYGRSGNSHDIGLIRTTQSMLDIPGVKAVSLPAQDSRATGTGIASGHGQIAGHREASDHLLHVTMPILSEATCVARYGRVYNTKAMLCAGGGRDRKSTCMGDSGGPFVQQKSDGSYTIIGLTSFGPQQCGTPGIPAVFTRVSSYVNWIKGKMY